MLTDVENSPASKVDASLCTEWWRGRCWPYLQSSSYSLKDCMTKRRVQPKLFQDRVTSNIVGISSNQQLQMLL